MTIKVGSIFRSKFVFHVTGCALFLTCPLCAQPEAQPVSNESSAPDIEQNTQKIVIQNVEPFTGKITKNRVRLRVQPHLESTILKELGKDDYLLVDGVSDDFYAVQPSNNMKAYIFRTYVIDGVVEGNNVNIRLEPDINAPILGQLHTGDSAQGVVSPINCKWLEIDLPQSLRFFVAKEYVNRIGDASVFRQIEQRQDSLEKTLSTLDEAIIQELRKPFKEIRLAPLAAQLHQIIEQDNDLPQYVEKAESLLRKMQEAYLQKSLASIQADFSQLEPDNTHENSLSAMSTNEEETADIQIIATSTTPSFLQREEKKIQNAIDQKKASSAEDFYTQEIKHATKLKGIVKPFLRNSKNAPGDFILIDTKTNIPIAFLFSTKIQLSDYINKEVSILGVERNNNDYAFPAFFVLSTNS